MYTTSGGRGRMAIHIRRREFIFTLGGVAAWPLAARAQQQAERMRLIGVLMGGPKSDPEDQARLAAFLDELHQLGWTDGRNVRIETRYAVGADLYRTYAAELLGLAPDVILASASASVAALQQASRSAPIVFANVIDPVGAGFVTSLAQPGSNATGFTAFEYGISGKW